MRACHPEPTLAVTGLVVALALSSGAGAGTAVLLGAAVLAGQLSVGWSNDWVDADRDRLVGRTDKPVVQGLAVVVLRRGALLALTACLPLSLLLGARAGAAHLVAVAAAWAYNAGVKATVLSGVPYVAAFALLPNVVSLAGPTAGAAPWWATVAGALLGAAAHGANVLPDLADDLRTGVRGLPQRLGVTWTLVATGTCLLGATVVLAAGPGWSASGVLAVALAATVFGVGVLRGRRPGSRAPFLSVLVVAALDVGLLLLHGTRLA